MPIEALKAQDHKNKELYLKNKALRPEINNTLKGVLLNNYIRPEQDENYISFDNIIIAKQNEKTELINV